LGASCELGQRVLDLRGDHLGHHAALDDRQHRRPREKRAPAVDLGVVELARGAVLFVGRHHRVAGHVPEIPGQHALGHLGGLQRLRLGADLLQLDVRRLDVAEGCGRVHRAGRGVVVGRLGSLDVTGFAALDHGLVS
jgi:hypothetical protein